ncbi:GTP-binding protein [Kangiella sediminilitoris]|uniref:Putative ATP/GTP-binding protein n=1 Tax=Kangiella sediminilitoris TaxID=1144748 RepID=A0A1B3B8L6_9GAMM|nr:GTPase [Kangiella sediminilitoris]AOE49137.1 Putative ATP/GTP-binding protein [Kangiella sediminilitoris]
MYRKLVVIGGVGAGKSTLIRTLSEIETVDTDVKTSQDIGKPVTTVGIDYGRITLGKEEAIGLYGVPGQERYSFIWDMVKEDVWGCALLLNSKSIPSADKLFRLLNVFINNKPDLPLVIGVTHSDIMSVDFNQIRAAFSRRGLNPPIFSVDARKKESSLLLLHTLMSLHTAKHTLGDTAEYE